MIETARLRLIPFDDAHFQALFQNDLLLLGHLLDVKTPKIWTTYADAEDVLPFFYESYMIMAVIGQAILRYTNTTKCCWELVVSKMLLILRG